MKQHILFPQRLQGFLTAPILAIVSLNTLLGTEQGHNTYELFDQRSTSKHALDFTHLLLFHLHNSPEVKQKRCCHHHVINEDVDAERLGIYAGVQDCMHAGVLISLYYHQPPVKKGSGRVLLCIN